MYLVLIDLLLLATSLLAYKNGGKCNMKTTRQFQIGNCNYYIRYI